MIENLKINNKTIILKNELLSKHTTFGIGGIAKFFVFPNNTHDIVEIINYCNKQNIKIYFLGSGSNLLISDNGFDGVVISLKKTFKKISFLNNKIFTESGVMLGNFVKLAIKKKITGFESMVGVPGTLGGALIMNAGAHGTEISEQLISIRTIDLNGKIKTYLKSELKFSYRESNIPRNEILIDALFKSQKGNYNEIIDNKIAVSTKRKETQPLKIRSAGSIFKNPSDTMAAGFLIDKAGLKGLRIGGAEISKKHANFIVNNGSAKSNEIMQLINIIKNQIRKKFDINLKLELKLLGINYCEK